MWNGFASTELLLSRGGQKPGNCVTQQMGAEQQSQRACAAFSKASLGWAVGRVALERKGIYVCIWLTHCRQQKLTP